MDDGRGPDQDGTIPALYLGHGAPPLVEDRLWTSGVTVCIDRHAVQHEVRVHRDSSRDRDRGGEPALGDGDRAGTGDDALCRGLLRAGADHRQREQRAERTDQGDAHELPHRIPHDLPPSLPALPPPL